MERGTWRREPAACPSTLCEGAQPGPHPSPRKLPAHSQVAHEMTATHSVFHPRCPKRLQVPFAIPAAAPGLPRVKREQAV